MANKRCQEPNDHCELDPGGTHLEKGYLGLENFTCFLGLNYPFSIIDAHFLCGQDDILGGWAMGGFNLQGGQILGVLQLFFDRVCSPSSETSIHV